MKKRSEGFFGLHFDFHAGADCTEIGKNVTEDMVREIIETLFPDYIQCDCKGHSGYSSYQTKAGNPAPGFVNDQLKIWRKVTKEHGVPLVMHYSGVWDTRAIELHPEWAAIKEDGSRNKDKTSTFKGYANELLIPQLAELANDYGVDAVWVDGDCWATVPDFDDKIIALFEKETGLKMIKDSEGKYDRQSKEYRAFLDFNRAQFFKYLAHYTGEIHSKAPNFEIASNWAFSSHIPRPVCVNVDYLSGDLAPADGYNSARFEARVLCEQNMPWDLMAWGFYNDPSPNNVQTIKSVDALCREAAAVISLGGGFQIYNTQNRDGSVRLWEIHELRNISKFLRDREPFLKGCKPFSDIGVLYSDYDMRNKSDRLFYHPGGKDETKSAVRLILDSAHSCGILMDYMLTDEYLKDKKTIILPELKYVSEEIKGALLNFAENGGNIIISGYECCKLFEGSLGEIKISGVCEDKAIYIYNNPRYISQYAVVSANVTEGAGTEILRKCGGNPSGTNETPIITKTSLGKGNIVAIYYNIFEVYYNRPDFYIRNMLSDIIDSLDNDKFIEYKGRKFVDIVPSKKDGKLMISLTNTGGIYSETRLRAYDEIQPLTDIRLIVKTEKEPGSVVLQPENIIPDYKYDPKNKKISVNIDNLHIHSILVIE